MPICLSRSRRRPSQSEGDTCRLLEPKIHKFSRNQCADRLFLVMERKDNEQKVLTTFLVEKLGRGIRIMSGNVETPKLPSKMKELLARLAKVPPPRK